MLLMSHPTPMSESGGYWTTSWYDANGKRRWRRFGPVARISRRDASAAYSAWLLKWSAKRSALAGSPMTIADLLDAYDAHAKDYYRRKDGTPTGEAANLIDATWDLRAMFGTTQAEAFGPARLKQVRDRMAESLAWTTCNARVNRIRRVFRWAVAEERLPGAVLVALEAVPPFKGGRGQAKEPEARHTPSDADVKAAIAKMPRPVAAMMNLMPLTGARPSELAVMRPCDVTRNGTVWTYKPSTHKTAIYGKNRVIHIGPRAQAVLMPFLNRPPQAYCFNPREVADSVAGKLVKNHYDRRAIYQAVVRACERAEVTPWSPYALRHYAATVIRQRFGEETARVVLGHSRLDTTRLYGSADADRAREAIERVG
jgi:integrase